MSKIKHLLNDNKLDGILFTSRENNLYLTKFKSSFSFIIMTKDKKYYFTDPRYFINAKKNIDKSFEIIELKDKSIDILLNKINDLNIKKLGFEEDAVSVKEFKDLNENLNGIEMIGISTSHIRIIKSDEEIEIIKRAVEITNKAFIDSIKELKINLTEKEVNAIFVKNILKNGGDKQSFDIIVAASQNGSNPHWTPSDYKIKSGDLVTIDFGVLFNGYVSDITRMILFNEWKSDEEKKIYDIVLKANIKAIEAAKPGIKCSELDAIARDYIASMGYGKYFQHSLGHGLGIAVHESPLLSPYDDTILKEGMIVTIEPGIYVPGVTGARIEDDILITKTGNINLTKNINKELVIIK